LGLYENYKRDITSLIKLSLIIKKAVIETDQFDTGIRRALNYGHTIGHAVEIASGYAVPHGIAVIMGMMAVNRVFGYNDEKFEELCGELLNGTSVNIQGDLKPILLGDKKATHKSVCFVVPKAPGKFSFETKEVTDVLCSKIKDILA
jgi:3-dehydroquinate synthase